MAVATITIPLDEDVVQKYIAASSEDQKKLQMLLSFWLREFMLSPTPLPVLMDDISEKARVRGLTPEILETLLHDD
jgi:hypothetical protein